MADARLQLIFAAKDLASREVQKLHGSMGKLKGSVGGVGHALGLLAKVGILAVISGLVAAIGFLGAATKAAAEEEIGIKRLDAALRANVKGFNGNTDAIETLIEKRGDLGFADDELRDSLTLLVAKYKDVDKAMALQAVAMDIARLKGISVTDASAMLTKALDGNQKILKQLGITLPATATEQERLAAIQAVAAGQAEAYGKTAAGAQAAFSVAIGNVAEDIGTALLPAMTSFFLYLSKNLIPAVRDIAAKVKKWFDDNGPLIDQIRTFVSGVLTNFVNFITTDVVPAVKGIIAVLWDDGHGPLPIAITKIGAFFRWFVDVILIPAIDKVREIIQWVKDAIANVKALIDWIAKIPENVGSGINDFLNQPGMGVPGNAGGGWVGMNGPEIRRVGELGPEYITPHHQLGGGGMSAGYEAVAISRRDMARMVDEELYFKIRRTPARQGA